MFGNENHEPDIEPLGDNTSPPDTYLENASTDDCNFREPILIIWEMSHEVIPMEIGG